MQGLHTHQQPESALLLLAEGPGLAPPQADPLQSLCQVLPLYSRQEDRYNICFNLSVSICTYAVTA